MVIDEPQVSRNGRYNIEDTCRLLGIHRNTLMRYVKKGRICFGIRRSTTRKYFTGSEILRFWKSSF